jgi:hypothetical protein
MGWCINYSYTSRKPMTQLKENLFKIFNLNFVYLRDYSGELKFVEMKPIAKSM